MSESVCFGIHLGNSSVCLVLNRDGKSEVIANDLGNRVTAAVLAFNDSEWEIGASAKLGQSRNKPVITNNKILLNNEIPESGSGGDCRLVTEEEEGGTSVYEIQTGDKVISLTPDDVATKLLSKMYNVGRAAARGDEELRCVLGVPLHWGEMARRRLETAAGLAGFSVLQVVSEPAAALLGASAIEDGLVLVYRLGGISCDVTLLDVRTGLFSVRHSFYSSTLGGHALTALLAEYIAEEFFRKWKLDPKENRRAMNKLIHHAEECKRVLSTLGSSHVHIESLLDGVDWSQNVTRARFDNLIASKLSQYLEPLGPILELQQSKACRVNKIVLCGGGMKVPKLQSAISALFPDAELLNGFSPDELIALGCAKQAELLLSFPDLNINAASVEVDCIEEAVYAKCNHSAICLFPTGTPSCYEVKLPLTEEFTQGNGTLNISIHENDNSKPLAEFTFNDVPKKANLHAILCDKTVTIKVI